MRLFRQPLIPRFPRESNLTTLPPQRAESGYYLDGEKPPQGGGVFSFSPLRAHLFATRSVQLGLKSSRPFSSAAHLLTLERGALEASTPPAGGAFAVPLSGAWQP